MASAPVGIVGRYVMHKFTRGAGEQAKEVEEPCEVIACQAAGEYGTWRILVATNDGWVLEGRMRDLRLVATPNTEGGPYR